MRRRLLRTLLRGAEAPLALLVAPAGYGKTTVLAQWQREDKRPFAWLTLSADHRDPQRLVASIASALGAGGATASPAFHDVAGALEARRDPLVLVLDNAHMLDSAEALNVVASLVDRLPTGSQLALASRGEPALPVGRLRAHRKVVELRRGDFMMTPLEAAALLDKAGLHIAGDELDGLLRRAEGWPAGLYLAALAACGSADQSVVADYLHDDILSGVSGDDIDFLTRASVLDRLAGPVCDAVLERSGSGRLLVELERSNVLLFPATGEDHYRLHPLLSQALRGELRRSEPDVEARLHRRASRWYSQRGDNDRAIRHAVAAHDAALAGSLMWDAFLGYASYGRHATVQEWVDHFTAPEIAAHPALALVAAASRLEVGDRNLAEHWTSAAARGLAGGALNGQTDLFEAGVMVLRAGATSDGAGRMGEAAMQGYEALPEDSPWRSMCCLLGGTARSLAGDRDSARALLEEGARRGAVAAPNVQALCLAQLALLALAEEDWAGGAGPAARARAQVERFRLSGCPSSALVFAVSAAFRAHGGHVDEAKMDARRAADLTALLVDFPPWFQVQVRGALARTAQRLSDAAGARRLVAEATRVLRGAPDAAELGEWLARLQAPAGPGAAGPVAPRWALTTAELRVLRLLPTHLSFPEVADRLNVSANTVKTHTRAVYRKLDASSRAEAVNRAGEAGLIDAAPVLLPEAA